jgi:single-stranded-DNA-specific exonuclease
MDLSVLPPKLLSRLSHAADTVRGHGFIHLFSHYDADGISSAAIVAKALFRAGKEFKLSLFTTLDEEHMDIVRGTEAQCIVMTDLGASYIAEFEEMDCDVVVLDHHTVYDDSEKVAYANPHLVGIDGMTSGCGATMALLFAVTLDENNWDLVQLAFAGMSGDRQTINGLSGLNVNLLEGAAEGRFVTETKGSLVPTGRLTDELFLTVEPYIRGVSGDAEGVAKLLSDARVEGSKTLADLNEEEHRRISSLIALKLTMQGVAVDVMEEIVRTRYMLRDWKTDSDSLASILDGCGRQDVGGIGVSAAMGDPRAVAQAYELDKEYRRKRIEGVASLDEKGLTQMENIQFFDSTGAGMTGVLCGIAMAYIGDRSKPTIGLNLSGPTAHLSSRGTWGQLSRGIDLSRAMKLACESVGGQGGGHRIAAGGSVPTEMNRDFLVNLDRIIGQQLKNAR